LDCLLYGNGVYRAAKKLLPKEMILPIVEKVSKIPQFTRMRGLRGMAGNMEERKSTLKHALTLPDVRITASNFVRDIFTSNGVDSPIIVNPYGHDLSWLKEYRGKSKSNVIRLGYVGQIIMAKGVHLILQAMSYLTQTFTDKLSLVIYGNLEHTPAYGQQIRDLAANLPNVTFGGTYPHSESARVFSEIDVLLVPSIWYDFPLIIYEAYATQTPVIATNLGGMAETVSNQVSGLLFERGDVFDLARQIRRLVEEPELLQELKAGIPKVKTAREEIDDLEKMYLELVRAGKSRS
jgi:glycosyltransferase involved in cell wall biosynthesis